MFGLQVYRFTALFLPSAIFIFATAYTIQGATISINTYNL